MKIPEIILDMGEYGHICKDMSRGFPISSSDPLWEKNPKREIYKMTRDHDFCFISIEAGRVVIVFNPSDDFEDWKSNVTMKRNRLDIHENFYNDAQKFFTDVTDRVMDNKTKKIYITGVSRGGALAQIVAYHISDIFKVRIEVYPIVSPRVGGKIFRDRVNTSTLHIHHTIQPFDIVDDMPPKVSGFRTVGHITKLRPKWWYFIPSVITKKVLIHKDWFDNLRRQA